jgi:WD40 repeat protein
VAFSPDGERFFSFGTDMYLRSYNVRNGRILSEHSIQPAGAPRSSDDLFGQSFSENPTLTSDAKVLMLGDNESGVIRFIDVETGKQREVYRPEGGFQDYVLSPNGKLLATFKQTSLQLRDFGSKKIIRELELQGRYENDLAFSPNGRLIAFTVREQGTDINPRGCLVVLEIETLNQIAKIENAPNTIYALAFSPDGMKLAASRIDAAVIVWDLNHFAQLTRHANNSTLYIATALRPPSVPLHGTHP